jgi:hypothetical protein
LDDRRTVHNVSLPSQKPENGSKVSRLGNHRAGSDSDDVEVVSPLLSELYSDVEIVESWPITKRKHDSKSGVVIDKKHRSL